ncbi:MAG: TraR/DksA family transcriptional regulator [Minisyncoccales bacterium]
MMKKTIEKLKQRLEKEKKNIEEQLKQFADKDKNLKADWDTRFPLFNGRELGSAALEQAADEVEEYENLLPIEHNLELKLKDINEALEKIKKGTYGVCEKCGKKISLKRLEVIPETKTCLECQSKE